jgi:hypothetical protein
MKLPKHYELRTWEKRTWTLTEPEYQIINKRLLDGARFLVMPDEAQSKVAPADIRFFGKRQISMGDLIMEQKALPPGAPKPFDPLSPGYIKFLAMSVKVKRGKGGLKELQARLIPEQIPLINAELERMGIDFRV